MRTQQCYEVMTGPVHACAEKDSVSDCADVMRRYNVGLVPIVDEKERLVGVITDRDLVTRAMARGKSGATPLREVMTSEHLVTCLVDDELTIAEEQMAKHGTSRVVITDSKERPRGIIALSDIALCEESSRLGEIVSSVKEKHGSRSIRTRGAAIPRQKNSPGNGRGARATTRAGDSSRTLAAIREISGREAFGAVTKKEPGVQKTSAKQSERSKKAPALLPIEQRPPYPSTAKPGNAGAPRESRIKGHLANSSSKQQEWPHADSVRKQAKARKPVSHSLMRRGGRA